MSTTRSADADDRLAGALAARRRMSDAFRAGDLDALHDLLAVDLVVQAPINRVVDHDDLFDRIRRHEVHHADGPATTNIEFIDTRGDLVVIMGEEVVQPDAGSSVRRRFTDIWRPHRDAWQLAIRQATNAPREPR